MNPLALVVSHLQSRLSPCTSGAVGVGLVALGVVCLDGVPLQAAPAPAASTNCPTLGWSKGLGQYLKQSAAFPTNNTPLNALDCAFHQWSWEAFVWATALNSKGVPRFLGLPTPDDLLPGGAPATTGSGRGTLRLGARSLAAHGTAGFTEGAGAIVEADGNLLVGPNGYPVYASVHMNSSYFATAKQNLIVNGGYSSQSDEAFFEVGAAVFKATWLRLDSGQAAPAGAYTTAAQVPVLTTETKGTNVVIFAVPGSFTNVTVALVGLHVVGYTINHPEFLWGTFEHQLNCPMLPDNTFDTNGSSPKDYTFYKANTPFSKVNVPLAPPHVRFDPVTQRFSPVSQVVLMNRTGGENQTGGASNIMAINAAAQPFLAKQKGRQAAFANYTLIGTVWLPPNTYNLSSGVTNAVGSVNLANSTAETFVQAAKNQPSSGVLNCFLCHNATSYSFQTNLPGNTLPGLADRRIALSHVLSVGTAYAVSNVITGTTAAAPATHRRAQPVRR